MIKDLVGNQTLTHGGGIKPKVPGIVETGRLLFDILPGENWFGGAVNEGHRMPWKDGVELDLRGNNFYNQAAPFFLSTKGRWLWSDAPIAFNMQGQQISIEAADTVQTGHADGLRGAYLEACHRFFPPVGRIPDPALFLAPQYNTWIELLLDQRQDRILAYAQAILDQGFPPGVLMIDEGWAKGYGQWDFDPNKFPDPLAMVDELHRMGFKVLLWVVPYICPDGPAFRSLRESRALLRESDGRPAIREWWQGFSAGLDLSQAEGFEFLQRQLADLRQRYGVDGFKFDGADSDFYQEGDHPELTPNDFTELYLRFGIGDHISEFRATWKGGGRALAQRLADRKHVWNHTGLASLIPNTLAQGLLGYPFCCPDMIGGGEFSSFPSDPSCIDQELFVRYAQASALLPMMQFSAAPWRVLDSKHLTIVREAAFLHAQFSDRILSLAHHATRTGEPIVRHLAYEFPGLEFENVKDQFLLGSEVLVAPVVEKGKSERAVLFPPGCWKDSDGKEFAGGDCHQIAAPLERLPYFIKSQ